MKITFVASECAPWVKTGGLGEVMGALPPALAKLGHQVSVFVPYYRRVKAEFVERSGGAEPLAAIESLTIPFPESNRFVRILDAGQEAAGEQAGVRTYFVDCPAMFDRDALYGTPTALFGDNAERFGLFSRAVLEASKLLGVPDILNANDWQTALVPTYLKTTYAEDAVLQRVGTVFTIHNAGYQGLFARETLDELLLPKRLYNAEELEAYGALNLFKGGLVYADALTTVSDKYAEELTTEEFGAGLDGVFRKRRSVLTGILNGVDYSEWDPGKDWRIAAHYSATDLSGKEECRRDLLHAFDADHVGESTAVIGMVSRLTEQKGFDLLAESIDALMREDIVLLVLGNGDEEYENLFRRLGAQYPEKLKANIHFDETLAHKIVAGADMSLMPSRYEPSGLNQMYSLRYGTVPVVRSTGGLEDTVSEGPDGDGFCFKEYDAAELIAAVKRALVAFKNKTRWQETMRRGMGLEFSWDKPAKEYVKVYERVIEMRSWRG